MIQTPTDLPLELRKKLPALRRKFPVLYAVQVDAGTAKGREVAVFRPLTKREADFLAADAEYIQDQSDILLSLSLLHPTVEVIGEWMAGAVESVIDSVVNISGWSDVNSLVESMKVSRHQAMTLDGLITTYICKAFPGITPDKVDDLTLLQQADLLAKAEVILQTPLDLDAILNPKKRRRPAAQRPWILDKMAEQAGQVGQTPMASPAQAKQLWLAEQAENARKSKKELLSSDNATRIDFTDPSHIRQAAMEQRRALGDLAADA